MAEEEVRAILTTKVTPCVSVVVAVHNSGDFLEQCLTSLAEQTLTNIEIIVVNDGSHDPRDREIALSFAKNSRFLLVDLPENRGTGKAREAGVAAASGDYIGFLDTDDFALPSAFMELHDCARRHDADIVVGNYATNNLGSNEEAIDVGSGAEEVLSGRELLRAQLHRHKRPYYLRVDWWNKIYRKRLFEKHNITFPKVVRNEGTMSMVLSALSGRCVILDKVFFYSATRPDSVCRTFRARNIPDTIESALHFKHWLKRIGVYDSVEREYINLFYFVIFNHNLKLIAEQEEDNSWSLARRLVSELDAQQDARLDFLRYLSLPGRTTERMLYAAIALDQPQPFLDDIRRTAFFDRSEGGQRLVSRRRPSGIVPLVSIVTITKDLVNGGREGHYRNMRESIEAQTYGRENIEHIVVDAKSKDGTIGLIEEKAKAPIDYWASEPDSGVYDAMNKALDYVSGEYVLFLNSDDYLADHAIEKLVEAVSAGNGDYAFADAAKINESGAVVGRHVGDMDKLYFGTPYCHQTLLCHRRCFERVRFDESFGITMWPFSLDLHAEGYRPVKTYAELAYFRVGGLSTDEANAREFREEQKRVKNERIVNNLNLTYDEYEYLNHWMRRWPSNHLEVDKACLLERLLYPKDSFGREFRDRLLRLLGKRNAVPSLLLASARKEKRSCRDSCVRS